MRIRIYDYTPMAWHDRPVGLLNFNAPRTRPEMAACEGAFAEVEVPEGTVAEGRSCRLGVYGVELTPESLIALAGPCGDILGIKVIANEGYTKGERDG